MDSGEPAGRGGSVAEGASDGLGVELAGVLGILELALAGEGVCVEPLEQGKIVSVAAEGVLGSVLLQKQSEGQRRTKDVSLFAFGMP